MNRHLILILSAVLVVLVKTTDAQVVNFTQYHLEPQFTNPANVAANEFIEVIVKYRDQSLESDLGFTTSGFTFVYPLFYNNPRRSFGGLAISVIDEQSGANNLYRATGAYAGFAYRINLKKSHFLSLGLQAGYVGQRVDLSKITTDAQFINGPLIPELTPVKFSRMTGSMRRSTMEELPGFISISTARPMYSSEGLSITSISRIFRLLAKMINYQSHLSLTAVRPFSAGTSSA